MEKQKRVGAISSIENGTMNLLGYGIYEGSKIPETDDVKFFGKSLKKLGLANDCILLDSGERVYGCECWWDSEDHVKELESKCHTVNRVFIKDIRE